MPKNFSELNIKDSIYRVDIDWLESNNVNKLTYVVTRLSVNGAVEYNHDKTYISVPYTEDGEDHHVMVPVENNDKSISFENGQKILTTDNTLIEEAINGYCDKEMKSISEQIDWCYQRISILENDYKVYKELKKTI